MLEKLFEVFSQIFTCSACLGCEKESANLICKACLLKIDRYYGQEDNPILSYGKYDGVLKSLIHQFKYENKFALAKPLAQLLNDSCPKGADLLIPIPMHLKKLQERKYNQSQLLAKELSKLTHIPVVVSVLKKIKYTPSQTDLSREKRKENIKESFQVFNSDKIQNKHIVIIDDVYTTGATVHEASLMLTNSGADKISVLTLAR